MNAEKQIAELEYGLAEMRGNYEGACKTMAEMHAAAVGEVTGPNRGVVEDVADLRTTALRRLDLLVEGTTLTLDKEWRKKVDAEVKTEG